MLRIFSTEAVNGLQLIRRRVGRRRGANPAVTLVVLGVGSIFHKAWLKGRVCGKARRRLEKMKFSPEVACSVN